MFKRKMQSLPPSCSPEKSGRFDYSPLHWSSYFNSIREFCLEEGDTFRVYECESENVTAEAPLLVLLHGAGYSGLTWAIFAKKLVSMCDCRILAIDLRCHGSSVNKDSDDLSAQTMGNDVQKVLRQYLHEEKITNEKEKDLPATMSDIAFSYEASSSFATIPKEVILVGHSMGGALAVHISHMLDPAVAIVKALVVIDVVEGTALKALDCMQPILSGRPKTFATIPIAIEWWLVNN